MNWKLQAKEITILYYISLTCLRLVSLELTRYNISMYICEFKSCAILYLFRLV